MRVLRSLFTSLLMLLIGAAIVGAIAREALLMIGVGKVRESLSEVKNIATQQSRFAQECVKRNGETSQNPVGSVQLRFISDTEFIVEVVCAQNQFDTIITSRSELPWMVKKLPGTSGIVWGAQRSGIVLSIFGRSRAVIAEDREIIYESPKEADLGVGPLTSCEGFGYQCCALDTTVGQGEQWTEALNCPKSCYQQCKTRPVVLSIATEPFYELETRTVTIRENESLTFTVLVEAGQASPAEVQMQYGDGQTDIGTEDTETYTHTYTCPTASCDYRASVVVTDSNGVTNSDTISSHVIVRVTD